MRGGGTLVVKAEELTIKSIEQSEVEERVRVENEVIHFDDYDEYATYTLTLENPTSTKLQVTNINLTNNECVSINTDELESTIVDANSTKEVTLTLTSDKCNVNQDNTALLTFKSKEYKEDKTEEEKEDIVSPNTYGNISVFLVILFILTAIYISLYIYSKKKPFKYLKLSTIIYLSLLIITTITYTIKTSFSANEESLSLTFSYTYKPKRVLMGRNYDFNDILDYSFEDEETFWEDCYNVKNIYIQNKIEEPSTHVKRYDASMNQDESILVYKVVNPEDSDYYDLYMMADGEIFTNVDSSMLFGEMSELIKIENLDYLDTSLTTNMTGMFVNDYLLENFDVKNFDTKNVVNLMGFLFVDTRIDLTSTLDLSGWDTSRVADMSYIFANRNIEIYGLDNFNTSKVTNMRSMFSGYSSSAPLDLSHFDTSKVTNMSDMFSDYNAAAPLDLSSFETSSVTNMSYMFSGYSSSAPLDLSHFDTSNVTDMSGMFGNYRSSQALDLSHLDTSNVTNMSSMFNVYSSNAPLDLSNLDTSNVTNMSYMFSGYSSSAPLDLSHFDTSNVTNMSAMFYSYSSSALLDLSSFNTSNVTNMRDMFAGYNGEKILDLSFFEFSNQTDILQLLSGYRSSAPIDLSSLNITNAQKSDYIIRINNINTEVYVANENVKDLLVSMGWENVTSNNVIVGSCEDGVCHAN